MLLRKLVVGVAGVFGAWSTSTAPGFGDGARSRLFSLHFKDAVGSRGRLLAERIGADPLTLYFSGVPAIVESTSDPSVVSLVAGERHVRVAATEVRPRTFEVQQRGSEGVVVVLVGPDASAAAT